MVDFIASFKQFIEAARNLGVPVADDTPEGEGAYVAPPQFPALLPTERRVIIDGEIPYFLGRSLGMPPISFVEDGHVLLLMELHERYALYKDLGIHPEVPEAVNVMLD